MEDQLPRLAEAAQGRWKEILPALGISDAYLKDEHGPCPACGGRNRFRFDDKDGRGTFFCSQCGAGDGIDLLVRTLKKPFKEVALMVEEIIGTTFEPKKPAADPNKLLIEKIWKNTAPLSGSVAGTYLRNRLPKSARTPKVPDLRFAFLRHKETDSRLPAMVALVRDPTGKPVTVHVTYLTPDGTKAPVEPVRRILPCKLPDGASVRLGGSGAHLCVAEGIETALAVYGLADAPVWAALNANMLQRWVPPDGVERVTIYGDNDKSFTGQAAAFTLAKRLTARNIAVRVRIPPVVGMDWLDWLSSPSMPEQQARGSR